MIIVGGVDVADEPELNYGMFIKPWKAALVRYALRNADRVLIVDESLRSETLRRVDYEGRNITHVPTGYDNEFWKARGTKRSEVLCVAVVLNESRVKVKGIDSLLEAARKLPNIRFTVIGVREEAVRRFNPPKNVRLFGPIERAKLLPYYQKSKVYCQPSRREGLPNTLCEGMLCECIPVVTNAGGNASAVGTSGFVVPKGDVNALADAIKIALKSPPSLGKAARRRITNNFTAQKRHDTLRSMIEGLLS